MLPSLMVPASEHHVKNQGEKVMDVECLACIWKVPIEDKDVDGLAQEV